jgi:hypothetical protein
VLHGEAENETQHDAGLLGPVVALRRELLQELVAPGDPDLAQSGVRERGKYASLHQAPWFVPPMALRSAAALPAYDADSTW